MIPPDYKALKEKLAEIQARAEKASAGPWRLVYDNSDGEEYPWALEGPECPAALSIGADYAKHYGRTVSELCEMREDDALFLAASREDIPFLLSLAASLRDENKRLQDEIERLKGYVTHKPECLAGDPRGVIPCVRGLLPETGAI